MAWVAVVVTVAGAAAAAYGSHKAGKAQDAMAKHNAKVAEQEALARQHAIASESRKLTKSQRNLQAKQRMSVASRGGLAAGSDLLTLADEAKEMQLDQLELRRQSSIAGVRGTSQAAMHRYEGSQARKASRWTTGSSLLSGAGSAYSQYKAGN